MFRQYEQKHYKFYKSSFDLIVLTEIEIKFLSHQGWSVGLDAGCVLLLHENFSSQEQCLGRLPDPKQPHHRGREKGVDLLRLIRDLPSRPDLLGQAVKRVFHISTRTKGLQLVFGKELRQSKTNLSQRPPPQHSSWGRNNDVALDQTPQIKFDTPKVGSFFFPFSFLSSPKTNIRYAPEE